MAKMAELHAALTELPDSVKEEMERQENPAKSDFMQGFYRGRAEGIAIGQEEGAFVEQERIIKLLTDLRLPQEAITDGISSLHNVWLDRNIAAIKRGNNG